jgi:hypothetical protein
MIAKNLVDLDGDPIKISHLPDLACAVKRLVSLDNQIEFPRVIIFNRGIEFSRFKITIEREPLEQYVDKNGETWKKVKK